MQVCGNGGDLVWAAWVPMATRSDSDGGRIPEIATLSLVPTVTPGSNRATGYMVLRMLMSERHIKNNVVQNVLKEAWARFGPVRISEVNETTLIFDFESSRDRDQILELSPWSVHGHSLNLKFCPAHMLVDEIDYGRVQMWVQLHGY